MTATPRNIVIALNELGIKVDRESGDEIWALCPQHYERTGKIDRHPSWSVNKTNGFHKCLAGETVVVTWDGRRPIAELAGTTQRLLTSSGWVDAPIYDFGEQDLWEVVLTRNGVLKTIRTTAEHRWFVSQGNSKGKWWVERTTENLRPNHRLRSVRAPRSTTLTLSPWGVAHGVTFGDGTRLADGTCRAVLLGAKDAALLKFFPLSPTNALETVNGVPGIEVRGLPGSWKMRPSLSESKAYLYGWLAGWFAADGCVSEAGQPTLASVDREALEFARDVAFRLGITTYGIRHQDRLGVGDTPTRIYILSFGATSLPESFLLIEQHRSRRLIMDRDNRLDRLGWSVVSATPLNVRERVYCATVAGVGDFALDDNLLTGNCFSCGYGGVFVDLVTDLTDLNIYEAWRWIRRHGVRTLSSEEILALRYDRELSSGEDEVEKAIEITEASLALFFRPPIEAVYERNLTMESIDRYDLLWDIHEHGWIIPVRTPDTTLIGWQFKSKRDFENYPMGMEKGLCVFGLELLEEGQTAIVIEAPHDCCRVYDAGVEPDVGVPVSTYGAEITDAQMSAILERTDSIIMALDNDTEGMDSTQRIAMGVEKRGKVARRGWATRFRDFRIYNYHGSRAKDEGEQTDEEIWFGLRNAQTPAALRMGRFKDWSKDDNDTSATKHRGAGKQSRHLSKADTIRSVSQRHGRRQHPTARGAHRPR